MKNDQDWDIEYYLYLYTTVLNHSEEDFWKLSPRRLFSQIDKHIQFNTPKEGKEERRREYVNGTEFM